MAGVADTGPHFVRIGIDVGKLHDPTAVVIGEHRRHDDGHLHTHLRHIGRLPLTVPYPGQCDRIVEIVDAVTARSTEQRDRTGRGFRVDIVLDATGVGTAMADMLAERRIRATRVTLTSSDRITQRSEDGALLVGKVALASALQFALQAGRLHIPDNTSEGRVLAQELADYRSIISEAGHTSWSARSGAHDDLVISAGLALLDLPSNRKLAKLVVSGRTRDPWAFGSLGDFAESGPRRQRGRW